MVIGIGYCGRMRVLDEKTDVAPMNAEPGMGYIFEHSNGKKCLVFVNSREECEAVTTTLRQYCEANGEPDRFLIHHGNLSVSYRKHVLSISHEKRARKAW